MIFPIMVNEHSCALMWVLFRLYRILCSGLSITSEFIQSKDWKWQFSSSKWWKLNFDSWTSVVVFGINCSICQWKTSFTRSCTIGSNARCSTRSLRHRKSSRRQTQSTVGQHDSILSLEIFSLSFSPDAPNEFYDDENDVDWTDEFLFSSLFFSSLSFVVYCDVRLSLQIYEEEKKRKRKGKSSRIVFHWNISCLCQSNCSFSLSLWCSRSYLEIRHSIDVVNIIVHIFIDNCIAIDALQVFHRSFWWLSLDRNSRE